MQHRFTRRNGAEELLGLGFRGGHVDVAGDHQGRVVRPVIALEPGLDVIERRRVEIGFGADGRPRIRVAGRVTLLRQNFTQGAIRLVLALALFVEHHAALLVELGLVDGAEQMAHAIGFQEQRQIECGRRHSLEIVGAIAVGAAVDPGGTGRFQRAEEFVVVVLGAVEHEVLEQMRETVAAFGLVLGTDVVPDVDRNQRRLVILVNDHRQAIGQLELLERHIDRRQAGGDRLGIGLAGRWPGLGRSRRGAETEAERRSQCDNDAHGEPRMIVVRERACEGRNAGGSLRV